LRQSGEGKLLGHWKAAPVVKKAGYGHAAKLVGPQSARAGQGRQRDAENSVIIWRGMREYGAGKRHFLAGIGRNSPTKRPVYPYTKRRANLMREGSAGTTTPLPFRVG
jgi:hypothetical protein